MVPTTWELKFLSLGIPGWSLKKPCKRWSNVYFLALDIRIAWLDPHFPSWFPSLISQISSKLRPTHGDQVGPLSFRSLMAKSVPACPKLQKKPMVSRALTRKRRANTHNGTSKTRNQQNKIQLGRLTWQFFQPNHLKMYLFFFNGECSIVMLVFKGANSIFKTTKENGASNLPMQVFGHVPDSEVCNLTIREVTKAPWQRGAENPG